MNGSLAVAGLVLMPAGFIPLVLAWLRLRETTLRPALSWALAAWGAWCALEVAEAMHPGAAFSGLRCTALSLTACAGVAVLGARRPGLAAWNFVVASLLLVLLLPVAQGFGRTDLGADSIFLCALLILTLGNFLPTRLGPAVLAVAVACRMLWNGASHPEEAANVSSGAFITLGLAPWLGWLGWRLGARDKCGFASTWRDFRDRYGWLWAQRVREQFNRAAANAGWPVELRWRGLQGTGPGGPTEADVRAMLEALLKRFGRKESDTA